MKLKNRRVVAVVGALVVMAFCVIVNPESYEKIFWQVENDGAGYEVTDEEQGCEGADAGETSAEGDAGENDNENAGPLATEILEKLEVKGRAPKTGYSREEFYNGWPTVDGCSLRQRILKRDFGEKAVLEECTVVAGEFATGEEPYTGEYMKFGSREEVSKLQIDHVVALSDAWQKGAQYLSREVRYEIATDPLNLLAVDGEANMQKSDGDAATWLPANKKFRCQYVARQISVKYKYKLWVTEAEKEAMVRVLTACPNQKAIGVL